MCVRERVVIDQKTTVLLLLRPRAGVCCLARQACVVSSAKGREKGSLREHETERDKAGNIESPRVVSFYRTDATRTCWCCFV